MYSFRLLNSNSCTKKEVKGEVCGLEFKAEIKGFDYPSGTDPEYFMLIVADKTTPTELIDNYVNEIIKLNIPIIIGIDEGNIKYNDNKCFFGHFMLYKMNINDIIRYAVEKLFGYHEVKIYDY